MPSLTLTPVESANQLSPWLADWERLVEHRPMRSPSWLMTWWEHYRRPSHELRVLLLHESEHLVGLAPLFRTRVGRGYIYKLLGSGSVCTDHTTLFAEPGYETAVAQTVARYFAQTSHWNRLHLEAIDRRDAAMQTLAKCFQQGSGLIHDQPSDACWSLAVPASWEDYLAVLSKSHRKRCRRLVRSFFDTGRISIQLATEDNFDLVWSQFLALHAARWGTPRQPFGVFSESRFEHFHHSVAKAMLERNQLRLCFLECDGRPVAAEYQVLDHDTLYAYQSGMTLETDRQPGNLSLIATIKFAIDRGVQRLDLLRGNESYKAHWRAQPQACHDLRIWPRNLIGCVGLGTSQARQIASSWLHRNEP